MEALRCRSSCLWVARYDSFVKVKSNTLNARKMKAVWKASLLRGLYTQRKEVDQDAGLLHSGNTLDQ
ncbi:MAG: hypothetical protein XE12_0918 [Synergistales bacterium 54_9]|nr:MAG: hypothetical protein XE12_0918 [Synergistales bacterium 54_9]